jgi:hypothetical protein
MNLSDMNPFDEIKKRFEGVEIKLLDPRNEAKNIFGNFKDMEVLSNPDPQQVAMIETRLIKVQEEAVVATVQPSTEIERRDIAGALFDFAAWLSTRPKVFTIGASEPCAGELADLLAEWAKLRGLSIENARVAHWHVGVCKAPEEKLSEVVNVEPNQVHTEHVTPGSEA